jgi:hypothetical protein
MRLLISAIGLLVLTAAAQAQTVGAQAPDECRPYLANQVHNNSGFILALESIADPKNNNKCQLDTVKLRLSVGNGVGTAPHGKRFLIDTLRLAASLYSSSDQGHRSEGASNWPRTRIGMAKSIRNPEEASHLQIDRSDHC